MKDTVINWVSVEEELPENDVNVLAYYEDDDVNINKFNRGSGWLPQEGGIKVVFWSYYNMPK